MNYLVGVNEQDHAVEATPDTPLLYVLSNEVQLNGPRFGGLTHERDPLIGSGPALESADGRETFSVQHGSLRRRCSLERFVTVRGGAYLFMPGLRGLAYLAEP